MNINQTLQIEIKKVLKETYNLDINTVELNSTRKEFTGDITLVVFPFLKYSKKSPEQTAEEIGQKLQTNYNLINKFNVVKGFLNLSISDNFYTQFLNYANHSENFGFTPVTENYETVIVEYSSPNTNKPLHLGHIRNNLLGFSTAAIMQANGKKIIKTQIINDRGIHICKSMVAWQQFGNGETPETANLKGDKLVGKYYVKFDQEYKKQIDELLLQGKTQDEAKKQAPIFLDAKETLIKWENKDIKTFTLWEKMNNWVYDGFKNTYKKLGVDFDSNYYESQTYLLGKDIILKGVKDGIFYQKEDNSVWVDLTEDGLDEKLLLRSDGTSVYITQDIGTAIKRAEDNIINEMIYTVGNEQDYHFKVLFLILKKLGYKWAEKLYHLSYGMVDLPSGKMKSREGTVVDADDLIENMTKTAYDISKELGKLEGYNEEEKEELYKTIGLGALKYHILKVDPKKRILFDPKESIDFNGNTGPFIQYTYARIQSILRKNQNIEKVNISNVQMDTKEKEIIKHIAQYPEIIKVAGKSYSPAIIANFIYDLVKKYNSFYQSIPIAAVQDNTVKYFRIQISELTGKIIKSGMGLLGINVPNRM